MYQPKISIITITFNSEKTLERTMLSVITQNYENLEYIIVDGGSTDRTLEIVEKYRNNIAKFISEPDKGISDAFNKGIFMATGDIIGIINSDDGLLPNALAILAQKYNPTIDVYRGKLRIINESTGNGFTETPTMMRYSGRCRICHPSTFVSKLCYNRIGTYDITCKYVMDYDWLLRCQKSNSNILFLDEELAFFTMGGVTFTSFTNEKKEEIKYVLRKNGANQLEIISYFIIKQIKQIIIGIFGKERIMNMTSRKRKE